jgi:aminopeptidase N
MSRRPGTLGEVNRLAAHPAFDLQNPNKVYALLGGFSRNQVRFHTADGSGYAFLADQILALDRLNAQVAARLARAFDRWRRFDAGRQNAPKRCWSASGTPRDSPRTRSRL